MADNLTTEEEDRRRYAEAALKRANETGVYQYDVNGKFMEYWSFYGSGEGWYFVRYDLDLCKEVFRGANIPFCGGIVPAFLIDPGKVTRYNYMVG